MDTLQNIHPSLIGLEGSESIKWMSSCLLDEAEGDWKHDKKFGMSSGLLIEVKREIQEVGGRAKWRRFSGLDRRHMIWHDKRLDYMTSYYTTAYTLALGPTFQPP